MYAKSKVKSSTRFTAGHRKSGPKSSHLRESPSMTSKLSKSGSRKSKSQFSTTSTNLIRSPPLKPPSERPAPNIPSNAAVHFGTFYGIDESPKKKSGGEKLKNLLGGESSASKSGPRMEFTRQMVRNLERAKGTEEYARQVSTILDETVEPASFKLRPPPAEDSVPDGKYNPTGFPLWYREPFKTASSMEETDKILREKWDEGRFSPERIRNVFEENSSTDEASDESSSGSDD